MKRYKQKRARRYKESLGIKGERDDSPKAAFRRKPYPPGVHGKKRRRISEYGQQLLEKQKLRILYGLTEKQFRRNMRQAQSSKEPTDYALLKRLEMRLDRVVLLAGFAESRAQARQFVTHGHFLVNDRKTDVPSYRVKPGDEITLKERSKKLEPFKNLSSKIKKSTLPEWLKVTKKDLKITVKRQPQPDEIKVPVDVAQVVEFYSR